MACRAIILVDSQLAFSPETILSSEFSDDLAMAELDNDKALVCYSDHGTNNYCRILTVEGGKIVSGNIVDLGERSGTYSAQPCVVSRLTENQGVACCEKPSWVPLRSYLECTILFASGSNSLTISGANSFGSSTLTLQSGFGRTNAERMVHVKDQNSGAFGKTAICYQASGDDQTKLTCDTLQVKESWSWMHWDYMKYLQIKSKDQYQFTGLDGTYTGRFFSLERLKEANPADLLACYRELSGSGQCKMLTR